MSFLYSISFYVDDILIVGNNMEMIITTQKWLSSTLEMKHMGQADYVLRVKISRDHSKRFMSLSQNTYIKRILEHFCLHNCKPVDTPMAKGSYLSMNQCPKSEEEKQRMARVPYASAVGSLMYDMVCT